MLNNYNLFLLESLVYDLLLESKLQYTSEFKDILKELSLNREKSIHNLAKFLLSISDKDMKLVQNFIGVDNDNDKVSFVPDNKVKLVDNVFSLLVSDNKLEQVVGNHSLIDTFKIPRKGLHFISKTEQLNGLPNAWTIVSTHAGSDLGRNFLRYTIYYLRNLRDHDFFILACDNSETGVKALFDYYETPEIKSNIKIGRFINRIMDIWFQDNKDQYWERSDFSAADVEKFVNAYTSLVLFKRNALNYFEIVEGEDIRFWYNQNNYDSDGGQLGASCMRLQSCQRYLDIYVENPEVCKLLIFKNLAKDKILGRAILWTATNGKKYMDRIYTGKDNYYTLYLNWLEQNKEYAYCYDEELSIQVEVKNKEYDYYPYMDTLYVYKREDDGTAYLHSDSDDVSRPYYRLQETNGGFSRR
jgi:hypothetical protein